MYNWWMDLRPPIFLSPIEGYGAGAAGTNRGSREWVSECGRYLWQPFEWQQKGNITPRTFVNLSIDRSKHTNDIMSLHYQNQKHHSLTDSNWQTTNNTATNQVSNKSLIPWDNSLWLWRWIPHRLLKCQSPSTIVLFRTSFARMIKLNLHVLNIVCRYLPRHSQRSWEQNNWNDCMWKAIWV